MRRTGSGCRVATDEGKSMGEAGMIRFAGMAIIFRNSAGFFIRKATIYGRFSC